MTAKEIREKLQKDATSEQLSRYPDIAMAVFLCEIAAQLATLNERLAGDSNPIPVGLCVTNDDIRVRVVGDK